MARSRMQLGEAGDARLQALVRAGETAERIAATMTAEGWPMSRATADKRKRELKGAVRLRGPSAATTRPVAGVSVGGVGEGQSDGAGASLPALMAELQEAAEGGAPLARLAEILVRATRATVTAAEDVGNLPAIFAGLRVQQQAIETMRKATPPERPDPNESPDMVATGKAARDRLHDMVALVIADGGRTLPEGWAA